MILLVDDEFFTLELISRKLINQGFKMKAIDNVKNAIDILTNNPEIKIVITDLHLPERSGFELLEWISVNRPEIKKIIVSAHTYEKELTISTDRLAYDYLLKKPLDVESELIPVLITVLKEV